MTTKSALLLASFVILGFVSALIAKPPATQPAKVSPERIAAVRAMYAKLPSSILTLTEPVTCLPGMWADMNGDAVTMTLIDAGGKRLSISQINATGALSVALPNNQAHVGVEMYPAQSGDGMRVAVVEDGSAAASAGIKRGDVLIKLDDRAIKKDDHSSLFAGKKPGDKADLTLIRDGKEQVAHFTFGYGGGGPFDAKVNLPPRGPEESALYGLLLRLPKADRDRMEPVLKTLDEHIAGALVTE